MQVPKNNAELREMAKTALEHWTFDVDTDPDGDIKVGLKYYAGEGDAVPDEDIASLFEGYKNLDRWDILEELARGIGSQ